MSVWTNWTGLSSAAPHLDSFKPTVKTSVSVWDTAVLQDGDRRQKRRRPTVTAKILHLMFVFWADTCKHVEDRKKKKTCPGETEGPVFRRSSDQGRSEGFVGLKGSRVWGGLWWDETLLQNESDKNSSWSLENGSGLDPTGRLRSWRSSTWFGPTGGLNLLLFWHTAPLPPRQTEFDEDSSSSSWHELIIYSSTGSESAASLLFLFLIIKNLQTPTDLLLNFLNLWSPHLLLWTCCSSICFSKTDLKSTVNMCKHV